MIESGAILKKEVLILCASRSDYSGNVLRFIFWCCSRSEIQEKFNTTNPKIHVFWDPL